MFSRKNLILALSVCIGLYTVSAFAERSTSRKTDTTEEQSETQSRGRSTTAATGRSGRSGRSTAAVADSTENESQGNARKGRSSDASVGKGRSGRSGQASAAVTSREGTSAGRGRGRSSGTADASAGKARSGRSGRSSGMASSSKSEGGTRNERSSNKSASALKGRSGRSGQSEEQMTAAEKKETRETNKFADKAQTMGGVISEDGTGVNYYSEEEGFGTASLMHNKKEAKYTAQALKEIAQLEGCKPAYNACMDQFCSGIDEASGSCVCSKSFKGLNNVNDELAKILAEINQMNAQRKNLKYGENLKAYTDSTQEELALSGLDVRGQNTADDDEDEEDDDDSDYTPITSLDDLDSAFDSFDMNDSAGKAKEGQSLYNAATKACTPYLKHCVGTQDEVKQAYLNNVSVSCNKWSAALDKKMMAAKMARQQAYNQYQEAQLKLEAKKNKYNLSQCSSKLYSCMQKEDLCGAGFKNCYEDAQLNRYKAFCEADVLDLCQDVKAEVWNNFLLVAKGKGQLDKSTCMDRLRETMETACGENFVRCLQIPAAISDKTLVKEWIPTAPTINLEMYKPQAATLLKSCEGGETDNWADFEAMMANELKLTAMSATALCKRAGRAWLTGEGRCETEEEQTQRQQTDCADFGFSWLAKEGRCQTLAEAKTACRLNDNGIWATDSDEYTQGYCKTTTERELDKFTQLRQNCEGTSDAPTGKFYDENLGCMDSEQVAITACSELDGAVWKTDPKTNTARCFSADELDMNDKTLQAAKDSIVAEQEAKEEISTLKCKEIGGKWMDGICRFRVSVWNAIDKNDTQAKQVLSTWVEAGKKFQCQEGDPVLGATNKYSTFKYNVTTGNWFNRKTETRTGVMLAVYQKCYNTTNSDDEEDKTLFLVGDTQWYTLPSMPEVSFENNEVKIK